MVIPPPSSFDFSNKILSGERARSLIHHRRVFFAGTIHWKWFDHYDDSYSHGVRQRLADLYQNQSFYPNVIIHDGKMELEEYFSALRASTFCLCPRGFATWSPRFVDSVAAGCIPVLIADHTDHPFSHILDYNKFSIILREEDATTSGKLMEILDSVRTEDIKRMKTELLAVQRHLSWNAEAPRWILSLLETKAKQIM